jgi:hypothetical protein
MFQSAKMKINFRWHQWGFLFFCKLKPYVKFQNPRSTPSGAIQEQTQTVIVNSPISVEKGLTRFRGPSFFLLNLEGLRLKY